MYGTIEVDIYRRLHVDILGIESRAPEVHDIVVTFQPVQPDDPYGDALDWARCPCLRMSSTTSALRKQHILVTALHNHWLFVKPPLFYEHWEKVEPLLNHARKIREALEVLRGKR